MKLSNKATLSLRLLSKCSFTFSKLYGIFTYFIRFANNMQNIVF